jgi:hypothetical protein
MKACSAARSASVSPGKSCNNKKKPAQAGFFLPEATAAVRMKSSRHDAGKYPEDGEALGQ